MQRVGEDASHRASGTDLLFCIFFALVLCCGKTTAQGIVFERGIYERLCEAVLSIRRLEENPSGLYAITTLYL